MQFTPPIDAVLNSIIKADRLLLTSHARPDGDAIGGLLALWMMLRQMGKHADMALSDRVPTSTAGCRAPRRFGTGIR